MKKVCSMIIAVLFLFTAVPASAESADTETITGTVTDDVYENRLFGIGCKLEGWHYLSEEEIALYGQFTKEILNSDEVEKLLDDPLIVVVMAALSPTGDANVNINIQKLHPVQASGILFQGLYKYLNDQLSDSLTEYQALGVEKITGEVVTVSIGDKKYPALRYQYQWMGYALNLLQIADVKDSYMMYLSITGKTSDQIDEALSHFYRLPE